MIFVNVYTIYTLYTSTVIVVWFNKIIFDDGQCGQVESNAINIYAVGTQQIICNQIIMCNYYYMLFLCLL